MNKLQIKNLYGGNTFKKSVWKPTYRYSVIWADLASKEALFNILETVSPDAIPLRRTEGILYLKEEDFSYMTEQELLFVESTGIFIVDRL